MESNSFTYADPIGESERLEEALFQRFSDDSFDAIEKRKIDLGRFVPLGGSASFLGDSRIDRRVEKLIPVDSVIREGEDVDQPLKETHYLRKRKDGWYENIPGEGEVLLGSSLRNADPFTLPIISRLGGRQLRCNSPQSKSRT